MFCLVYAVFKRFLITQVIRNLFVVNTVSLIATESVAIRGIDMLCNIM